MTKLHVLRPAIPRGPVTRGECRTWTLPCRLRACRYNLGHREPGQWHRGPTDGCALDVAEAGPSSEAATASALGMTVVTARTTLASGLRKMQRATLAQQLYRESEGQADRAGASLPGGMEDES